jgi:hypothetical protein
MMLRYERISGLFFSLLAAVQLIRLLFRWPVQVASVSVPLWPSVIAVLILSALATWAFRAASALPQD